MARQRKLSSPEIGVPQPWLRDGEFSAELGRSEPHRKCMGKVAVGSSKDGAKGFVAEASSLLDHHRLQDSGVWSSELLWPNSTRPGQELFAKARAWHACAIGKMPSQSLRSLWKVTHLRFLH